eukprot:Pompholyxophrys_punicea_v1_NODE_119_length_3359_cov_12.851998.p1 type:complete len:417 gc:universal NODE_119_length_3359_cov_12.851998:1731-2981(+)
MVARRRTPLAVLGVSMTMMMMTMLTTTTTIFALGPPDLTPYDTCVVNDTTGQRCPFSNMTNITRVYPGGNTTCYYHNSTFPNPYTFQVFPGRGANRNKLMLHHEGGGACVPTWQCLGGTKDQVLPTPDMYFRGIFNSSVSGNPFQNWTIVMISYCTGDIQVGNGVESGIIHFGGRADVKAVLNWTRTNIPNPDRVVFMGSSSGAFGLLYWANPFLNMFKAVPKPPPMSVIYDGWVGLDVGPMKIAPYVWNACSKQDFDWTEAQYEACNIGTLVNSGIQIPTHANHPDVVFAYTFYKNDPVAREFNAPLRTPRYVYGLAKAHLRMITYPNVPNKNIVTFIVSGYGHVSTYNNNFTEYYTGAQAQMEGQPSIAGWLGQLATWTNETTVQSYCTPDASTWYYDGSCDPVLTNLTFHLGQ